MEDVAGFDWDDGAKHGVSIDEIEAIFGHQPRTGPDLAHSSTEERFIAVGGAPRLIFVVYTLRDIGGRRCIRPISARYMHRKEIDNYA